MKRNFITAGFVLAFVSITTAGFAQATPVVKERQVNQQKRIGEGVKSGELTAKETRHLEAREIKIQQDKKEAKSDGVVTAAERAKLQRSQNRTSRAIYRQKHDTQTRH
ncbi:MAG: hypothetical protein ABIU63_17270 [Chitinophagaceae bacterium]